MNEMLEIVATITGIVAVWLQAKEKIMAWPFAIVTVIILAYIFYGSRLYSDFGLHLIYILLNIYGWFIWSKVNPLEEVTPTVLLQRNQFIGAILIVGIGTLLIGFLNNKYTNADLAYFDAFTTSGSLVAQYLLSKKYLQNWLFWIVVDLVAIPMYLYKELYYVAFLFTTYLVICTYGYLSWKKSMATES